MGLPTTRPRRYQKSGLYCRPTRLDDLPPEVAEARRVRRDALVGQLGGIDEVTPAQAALIDLVVSAAMQLDSVDAYLLTLPSLVDKRGRRVWPVVRDRMALSGHVQGLLRDLGLERKAKRVRSLDEYLTERERTGR
jgi:hypothetical protein